MCVNCAQRKELRHEFDKVTGVAQTVTPTQQRRQHTKRTGDEAKLDNSSSGED